MSAVPDLWTLVLAAGGSQRMGSPKQALPLGTDTLLRHAVTQAGLVTPGQVVCVLGAYVPPLPLPCITCLNPLWRSGMASSLAAGINKLPTDVSMLITLCDQPGVRSAQLNRLVTKHRDNTDLFVAAQYAGKVGVPAIFPPRARARLLTLTGDQGARALLREPGDHLVTVDMPEAALDIDTEQDWRNWLDKPPRSNDQ